LSFADGIPPYIYIIFILFVAELRLNKLVLSRLYTNLFCCMGQSLGVLWFKFDTICENCRESFNFTHACNAL